jgi:hypothetical protein
MTRLAREVEARIAARQRERDTERLCAIDANLTPAKLEQIAEELAEEARRVR